MNADLLMQLRSYRKQLRFEMPSLWRFLGQIEEEMGDTTADDVLAFMEARGIKLLPWQLDKLGR